MDAWDESLGARVELYCCQYRVEHITPKGARIHVEHKPPGLTLQPVMDHYINKYAYPSKVEALLGFIARKKRQQVILFRQYSRSREAEQRAEQMLAKELEC